MTNKQARVASVFKTMSDFPVLSGRVTERQAELIIERLDERPREADIVLPELGKSYLTADGNIVKMTMLVDPSEHAYDKGYRFVSNLGVYYTAKGWTNPPYPGGVQDLVKEVTNTLDDQIERNRNGIIAELGYLAAMGRVISAVKLYRSVFGGGLILAKQAVMDAKADAERQYEIPLLGGKQRIQELENCLKETRKLVSRCSINGFRDSNLVEDLFRNNGAITRLVPMNAEERQASQEDLNKIMAMDDPQPKIS